MLNQPIFESCFEKVRISQKFEILAIVVFLESIFCGLLFCEHTFPHIEEYSFDVVCVVSRDLSPQFAHYHGKTLEIAKILKSRKYFQKHILAQIQ